MRIWKALIGIIDRPASTMAQVASHPGRSWALPIGLCVLAAVIYGVVAAPLTAELSARETQKLMASMPVETAEQMEQYVQTPSVTTSLATGVAFGVLGVVLGWLVWTGAAHLLSSVFGGESELPGMMAVMAWAWIPFALRPLVLTGYIAWKNELMIQPGLSALVATGNSLADAANPLFVLLASLDPFLVWNLVLVTLGIAAASRISRTKSAALALGLWLAFTMMGFLPGWISSAMVGSAAG